MVHAKCRRKYILQSEDKLQYKHLGPQSSACSSNYSPAKSKVRKSLSSFDFDNNCFVCGLEANINKETKKSITRRQKIHLVTSKEFQENLENMLKHNNDTVAKEVQRRIACTDLLASNARYHGTCYRKDILHVYLKESTHSSVGRPSDEDISADMEVIFQYIQNSNDVQFSLQELANLLGNNSIIFLLYNIVTLYSPVALHVYFILCFRG